MDKEVPGEERDKPSFDLSRVTNEFAHARQEAFEALTPQVPKRSRLSLGLRVHDVPAHHPAFPTNPWRCLGTKTVTVGSRCRNDSYTARASSIVARNAPSAPSMSDQSATTG